MKLLLILAALQADTMMVEMQVSWPVVTDTVEVAEVWYAITDWPVEPGGWTIATMRPDTFWHYDVEVVRGIEREVCVKTFNKTRKERVPVTPVSIEVRTCIYEEGCRVPRRLYSTEKCKRYVP